MNHTDSHRLDHDGEYKIAASKRLFAPVFQNVRQVNLHMNNNATSTKCRLFNPISGMSKSGVIISSLFIALTAVI